MQKPFSSVLSRRVYHVSLRVHSQSSRKKPENIRRHHVTNFQTKDRWRSLKGINWKQRREVLASEKGLQLMKVITAPVKKHLFWYGAVCSRACFCVQQENFGYSGNYKARASKVSSWTKCHVPNWFAQRGYKQKSVCQSRLSSRQNFVLSLYQAVKFADFNIRWCGNWSFTVKFWSTTSLQKMHKFQILIQLYLTMLVYLQLWFWIKMPQTKKEEARSLSKYERKKLQRLYTQGGGAYWSVRNLMKTSNLPVSKLRQFLHSEPLYTKFTLATRKI